MKKTKYLDNSRLIITKKINERQVVDVNTGEPKTVFSTKKEIANGEVNLGSLNNPNKKIIFIEYEIPEDEDKDEKKQSFFKTFFDN